MKNEVTTKTGRLTAYGFGCGYQESKTNEKGGFKKIWHEGGVYHVMYRFCTNSMRMWENLTTLKGARKLYDSIKLD